ncbi:MAG: hypothetical protein LBE55_01025 [Clostridiales bacterium]|jgi:hypothetical protein|nr:hypothetical protein [Clostridiales bacterium]
MPGNQELRREQTERLFDLLKLKNDNKDIEIRGLDVLITRAKASMVQEDVAWVEKALAELYK